MEKHDLLSRRRTRNWETRLIEMLRDRMLQKARAAVSEDDLARYAADIAEHKRDPYSVVEEIAARI
jgi:primosomal protein N''